MLVLSFVYGTLVKHYAMVLMAANIAMCKK